MRWHQITNLQKECYERNCVCEGCIFKRYDCQIKFSLIEYIKKYGHEDLEEKKESEV